MPIVTVSLADGKRKAKIEGHDSIAIRLDDTIQVLHNVLFIPTLSISLLSVKQHSETQGKYFHAEGGEAILAFKHYVTSFPMTNTEIVVLYKPVPKQTTLQMYNKCVLCHPKYKIVSPQHKSSTHVSVPTKTNINQDKITIKM